MLGAVWWATHRQDRATVLAQSEVIARELVSGTNWPHLSFPGHFFEQRIAAFRTAPARVEGVRYGDEPRSAVEERAASRVYLINQRGERLALRLAPDEDHAHWHILGWWVPKAPPAAAP